MIKTVSYILIESYRRLVQWFFGCEIFEFPGLHALRVLAMRSAYPIGSGAKIGAHIHLTRQHRMQEGHIRIGKNVTMANGCSIDFSGGVNISDNVTVSAGVVILSHTHKMMAMADGDHEAFAEPVNIGYGAWLGTNAIILPGITIGQYAVVGAGAVVTHNVPDYAIVAGNPAKQIKDVRDE